MFGQLVHSVWNVQRVTLATLLIGTLSSCGHLAAEQPSPERDYRSIRMEVFVRGDRPSAEQVRQYVDRLQQRVRGIDVRVHDLLTDREQLARFYELAERAGRDKPVLPAFYLCQRMYFGFQDAETTGPQIDRLRTANVYTRTTCPKCQDLKQFLPTLQRRWPAVRFVFHDVDRSADARSTWQSLCRGAGSVPGLPTIDFARRVIVGYRGDEITGAQLDALIEQVSGTREDVGFQPQPPLPVAVGLVSWNSLAAYGTTAMLSADSPDDLLQLPDEAAAEEIGAGDAPVETLTEGESIEVPWLGRLSPSRMGMPMFTFVIGLVDGFNPCAMWVLVFLLSVLVNIKDRRKIIVIAGTFVIVSGVAYFAFMAAWLNVFMLIGIKRPVQIILGVLALTIGVINVKDFFAFKKGVTLSIPESQKPKLYRRVREIVSARYLTAAISGAVTLAVIVNMIELLCTAGLPALYTQVLTMQEFPEWKNYAYLLLYNVAYMLDDSLLVAAVVATLSHRKLQEREGRWLKLLSGAVILLLGALMIFCPGCLQLG